MTEIIKKVKARKLVSKPIYIKNLVLENVKCFTNRQELDFADPNNKPVQWTIILGENGTGKTTLLQHIAGLEFNPKIFNFKEENLRFSKLMDYYTDLDNPLYTFFNKQIRKDKKKRILISSEFYEGKLSLKKFNKDNIFEGAFIELKFKDNHELDNQASQVTGVPSNRNVQEINIYGYGASRKMGSGSIESNISDNANSLFSTDEPLINVVEFFLQADYAVKSSEGNLKAYAKNRLGIVKNVITKILPDVENIRSRPMVKPNLEAAVEALTPFGWINIKDLSYGYQTLMAWVVDLAARLFKRYPNSSNPLEEPAIVLVDEIDLHLHPKWQRTIISYLSDLFPQSQFIVTAHSPLIVQSVPENITYNIAVLKREGNEVRIYNKDEEIYKGWRIDQLYTSDLVGLESTRPVEYDKYLIRRNELMHKARLTEIDKEELIQIGKKLDELSFIDNIEDNKALKDLQKATSILNSLQKKNDKSN